MKYLLDTNILIYAFKGQGHCRERLAQTQGEDLCLSTVTVFELEYGLAKSTAPARLRHYLDGMTQRCHLLDMHPEAAQHAAAVRAFLEKQGQPIGTCDLLIAGTALAHGLTLVTHNTREFSRVPGLQLEDWFEETNPV